jgi:hypothetical protein
MIDLRGRGNAKETGAALQVTSKLEPNAARYFRRMMLVMHALGNDVS